MLEREGGRQAADPGPMIATGPSRLTVITFPAQAPSAPHPAGQLLLSGACADAGQVGGREDEKHAQTPRQTLRQHVGQAVRDNRQKPLALRLRV
jgi:hypothetical protein